MTDTTQPLGILFAHGWGADAAYLDPLAKELEKLLGSYPQCRWDRGYFHEGTLRETLPPGRWIGIGHSLGFHRLLGLPLEGFVSLAGFTRFCSLEDMQSGTPTRHLLRMISQFQKDPELVLNVFMGRTGLSWPKIFLALGQQGKLLDDLMSMRLLNVIPSEEDRKKPLLVLADKDDHIVSQDLLEDNFRNCEHVTWRVGQEGGHAFPYMNAAWCAKQIQGWMVPGS